jgi:two-component system OmpR family response regulator
MDATAERGAARRVLVVDDEPSITDAVATALRYDGYDVRDAGSGEEAIRAIETFAPELIILDVMLPGLDGLGVARHLRERRELIPVIFLSARDATDDKIAGLALGDDYVTKPFSLAELLARVDTVLRRARADERRLLVFGDVELDEDTHRVRRGEHRLELTPTEFALLRLFLENPRRVLSKRQILDRVWPEDFRGDETVVETYVSYLRKKLDVAGPPLIRTMRMIGYVLREPDE